MNNELYHYGVKGMRWGHRKRYEEAEKKFNKLRQNPTPTHNFVTKQNIKDATAARKEAYKNYKKAIKSKASESEINKLGRKYEKADFNETRARATRAGERAELKSYARQMYIKSGVPGSNDDRQKGGRSTNVYNELNITKGKGYADAVLKKNNKIATAALSAVTAVGIAYVGYQGFQIAKELKYLNS